MLNELPIEQVESLMVELAFGAEREKTGQIVEEHLQTGGKRLRALLALAACKCLRASVETAIPWAAACELLHNATLIHDDLQDGDRVRRGQPTTWVTYGMPSAINAGDLLLVLPTIAVSRLVVSLPKRWHLSEALATYAAKVIRGQVAEFEMTRVGRVSLAAYEAAIDGKTSPLFELPVLGSALIADRSLETARAVSRPFSILGRLFQMQDDVLDLYGENGREAPGADIREGKISALVATHLQAFPNERDEILSVLKLPRNETPTSAVDGLITRFRDAGTLQSVLRRIEHEAAKARDEMQTMGEHELHELVVCLQRLVTSPIAHLLA